MGLSATHLLILIAVVVLLFGRNKISELMGDLGKGIKSFKKGIADDPVPGPEIVGDQVKHASRDSVA